MLKVRKITLISVTSILIILLLLYLFMPIKPRLSILGYRLDNGNYGFTEANSTYTIQIESNEITAITTESVLNEEDLTASFSFFDDSNVAAAVTVETEDDTGLCTYTPGFNAALTCEDITLSAVALDALKELVEYHLVLISFEFDWTYIPDYQR